MFNKPNTKVTELLKKLNKNKPKYEPKFKVGDIIINNFKDLKIVSEVKDIQIHSYGLVTEDPIQDLITTRQCIGNYVLKDLVNEHKLRPENLRYTRTKDIQAIDAKYSKVEENVARLLYGSMLEGTKK